MTEKENKSNVEDELKSIKDEMKELKEMLKKKAREEEEEDINIGSKRGSRGYRVEIEDEDFKFEGVDETLGDYLSSVMQGVASSLSNSMKQMTQGFQIDLDLSREMEKVEREVEKNARNIEREVRRAEREAHRAARDIGRKLRDKKKHKRHVIRFQKLSDEELVDFYKEAPNLASALSDERKLKLLKALEDGGMYQKDLSESTDIKGGTFKHHMDSLLEVNYVQQEAVRGRYLITQLGVEALKLSEMLFRRYMKVTEKTQSEDEDLDEDLEEEIEDDIASSEEAAENLQNEEEEG